MLDTGPPVSSVTVRVISPAGRSVRSAHKSSYLSIALARQENVSVDQLGSIALAYQVSAWRKRDTTSERSRRGNWEKFDCVIAKVKDVPPLPGDEK